MNMDREEYESGSSGGGVFLIIIALVLLLGIVGWRIYQESIQPIGTGKNEKLIQVVQGETSEGVFTKLEKENLIASASISKIYMRLFGSDTIYAGQYRLNDGMSLNEIIKYISNAENGQIETNTLTVGGGDWAKTIAGKIEAIYPDYKAEDTINLWNSKEYIEELSVDYSFIKPEELASKDIKVKLEGYLYPETYFINKDATLDEITRTMLDQFKKVVYNPFKEEFENNANGYTINEIVTMASIVQFEAGAVKDMKMIARVFENRQQAKMKLESSATVCYGLYDKFDSIMSCESNPTLDSPYNTYLHEGLPPGPIMNPSKEAVQAVLEPAEEFENHGQSKPDKDAGSYYFFAADIYHKSEYPGAVYYTKTLEEHEAKCNELGLFG